jgi:hypothetical protein
MTYYKTLSWHNPPRDEILSLITPPTIQNPKIGYVGRISDSEQLAILKLLNVDEKLYDRHNILLVYFLPKSKIMIHTDHRPNVPAHHQAHQTIILPLKNCEKLKWGWHEVINPTGIFNYGEDNRFNPVPNVKEKDTKVLKEIYCTAPFMANIEQWHNLVNEGEDIAIGISLRLLPWSCDADFTQPPIPNITIL